MSYCERHFDSNRKQRETAICHMPNISFIRWMESFNSCQISNLFSRDSIDTKAPIRRRAPRGMRHLRVLKNCRSHVVELNLEKSPIMRFWREFHKLSLGSGPTHIRRNGREISSKNSEPHPLRVI